MVLVENIHPYLGHANYKSTAVKLQFIAASFLFFSSIFLLTAFISTLSRTYRNLRRKEKVFWNLAVVRSCYGVFCIIIGIWGLFYDTELKTDVVFSKTQTSYFAVTTTIGFFVFECIALMISDVVYKKPCLLLNVHHWLSLTGFVLVLTTESIHFFSVRGLILEMSTPFSAICWIVLKAGKAHTVVWKVNQFILVHTFHLRSVVECYIWYETYRHWDHIWEHMPLSMFSVLYIQLTLVTFLMTPYWTYKKSEQMIKPIDWNFEDADVNKHMNGEAKKIN